MATLLLDKWSWATNKTWFPKVQAAALATDQPCTRIKGKRYSIGSCQRRPFISLQTKVQDDSPGLKFDFAWRQRGQRVSSRLSDYHQGDKVTRMLQQLTEDKDSTGTSLFLQRSFTLALSNYINPYHPSSLRPPGRLLNTHCETNRSKSRKPRKEQERGLLLLCPMIPSNERGLLVLRPKAETTLVAAAVKTEEERVPGNGVLKTEEQTMLVYTRTHQTAGIWACQDRKSEGKELTQALGGEALGRLTLGITKYEGAQKMRGFVFSGTDPSLVVVPSDCVQFFRSSSQLPKRTRVQRKMQTRGGTNASWCKSFVEHGHHTLIFYPHDLQAVRKCGAKWEVEGIKVVNRHARGVYLSWMNEDPISVTVASFVTRMREGDHNLIGTLGTGKGTCQGTFSGNLIAMDHECQHNNQKGVRCTLHTDV
ncbi:hypothetical protein F4604DRAFT_1905523 [Suillus subluteus]|nr:hypothetical protein F4604DRAFT_1905523 [Suillus subluteus]